LSIETQTKISLISKALVLAGEKTCESLSDDRYGVTVMSALFEIKYESLLQSNRWRFSMKKGSLSRLNVDPLNEYRYAYQLPSDCLLWIGMTYPQDYEIYGDRLYTNATSVEGEYQFKPAIDKLPAHFSLLLSYDLAQDAISPITENDARVKLMAAKFITQKNISMFADAQSRPNRPIAHSPFTDGR
jgi:hypothetical protein